ncbi:MAG: hypothetical protein GY829_07555 [Gammaproteobacteria bacterium]|nr:hypothetical protein [Gammaproteobacteria bacterium]MCP4324954.1 hypothetical protein [Alteromonadales bacterium]
MIKPKPATLTPDELQRVLTSFRGKQQTRVIKGIHDNPAILTHDVCGQFYCNNVPDIAQTSNARLAKHGLKLFCVKPHKKSPVTNSHHWYLCDISQLEYFDIEVKSANDEVIK